jgi:hypothetical protein
MNALKTSDALAGESATDAAPAAKRVAGRYGNEARDKWIYDQCRKMTDYKKIVGQLKRRILVQRKGRAWKSLFSAQSVRQAAIRFANRKGLPAIPRRTNR